MPPEGFSSALGEGLVFWGRALGHRDASAFQGVLSHRRLNQRS